MKRVLFVDDEPNLLEGLRRALWNLRHEWDMKFEASGKAALQLLDTHPVDVVVSDMRMPEMDGTRFLAEVKRLHPETIRIILSGNSERATLLRSIACSHQYLSKPCDPEVLRATVSRALALRELLSNDALLRLASGMEGLPSLTCVFRECVAELQDLHSSLERISRIIERDIGMTARILQAVNSSYFGLRQPISRVDRAVTHLGLETVSALVLSTNTNPTYLDVAVPGFPAETVQDHSARTAAIARAVAGAEGVDERVSDDAFTAGMLHDAGKLILAVQAPERYAEVQALANREGLSLQDAERELLGATHAEVGAYAIGAWGLPDSVVEAVAHHHEPRAGTETALGAPTIVHVADGLAREIEGRDAAGRGVDLEHLERLGLAGRLEVWRQNARAVLGGVPT